MLEGKLLTVIAALVIVVILAATWKVVKKIKTHKKAAESTPPPPEPETAAPTGVTFMITFSEEFLAEMEQLQIITCAQEYKELVYYALAHYNAIARLSADGNIIYAQHSKTGKVMEINSEQLRTASRFNMPKA